MQLSEFGPNAAYSTRRLTPPDLGSLQSLFDRAADYFEVATGAPPAKDEARRAFVAGPPDRSVDDKRIIGVFGRDETLVGVLDALVEWPAPDTWSVGMVLIDPAHRGAGLGRAVVEAFERWAGAQGAARLRTAVVAHHADGIAFLHAMGYESESRLDDYDAGARRAAVLFFTKGLRA